MITRIELAKSSRSVCQCCKQTIRKNELRGIEEVVYNGALGNKYYCMSCSLNLLHVSEKFIQKLIKEIINYVKN